MAYDLEAELLRAARALRDDTFTLDELRDLIAQQPERFPRLAHACASHLIAPLAERLATDDLLSRTDDGYALTDRAHAYFARAPAYLRDTREDMPDTNTAIASFQWGQIVDASGRVFKDARLFPGGIEEWDWRKTGTRHDPGIQIADLVDLVAAKPDVVILSRGIELVLQVPAATLEFARRHAGEVLVLQSEQAVAEYNKRIAHERCVALVHSTC